jgi:ribosomal protein S4
MSATALRAARDQRRILHTMQLKAAREARSRTQQNRQWLQASLNRARRKKGTSGDNTCP